MYQLKEGDCLELLKDISDNSIDSIITDPPYGLSNHKTSEVVACLTAWIQGEAYQPKGAGFMGKSWDAWVPGPEVWKECLRVLKPGGHLLAFAGTRSMDLMSMAIRLAGFELRDSIGFAHDSGSAPLLAWCHGKGFPKSMNISKKIEDAEAAKEWEGWGTGLKPAWEPIMIARKPVEGTVAENVLKYGTGGLSIDECRVGTQKRVPGSVSKVKNKNVYNGGWGIETGNEPGKNPDIGRHAANVIHDGSNEVLACFPETKSGAGVKVKMGKDVISKQDILIRYQEDVLISVRSSGMRKDRTGTRLVFLDQTPAPLRDFFIARKPVRVIAMKAARDCH